MAIAILIVSMILPFLILLLLYLAIVHLIALAIRRVTGRRTDVGVTVGALVGYMAMLTVVVAATLIVESDESYWVYGPGWRFDVLFVSAAAMSLLFLILGPLWGTRRHRQP